MLHATNKFTRFVDVEQQNKAVSSKTNSTLRVVRVRCWRRTMTRLSKSFQTDFIALSHHSNSSIKCDVFGLDHRLKGDTSGRDLLRRRPRPPQSQAARVEANVCPVRRLLQPPEVSQMWRLLQPPEASQPCGRPCNATNKWRLWSNNSNAILSLWPRPPEAALNRLFTT